ncbi:hypothetical protein [Neorhizobium petrolearium]|uniref:hypothetical protein n=1 Tax=Neorhizobium petrolearium TaxID=515361 RepID=UPI003F180C92
MQAAAYFHSDTYHNAIDKLETIARTFDPEAPDMLRSAIIEALGDLGIWPMGIFDGQDEGRILIASAR